MRLSLYGELGGYKRARIEGGLKNLPLRVNIHFEDTLVKLKLKGID